MTYHFFFDRKRLILLASLLGLAGLLLFVAGILVGMRLGSGGGEPTLDAKIDVETFGKAVEGRVKASSDSAVKPKDAGVSSGSGSTSEPKHGDGKPPSANSAGAPGGRDSGASSPSSAFAREAQEAAQADRATVKKVEALAPSSTTAGSAEAVASARAAESAPPRPAAADRDPATATGAEKQVFELQLALSASAAAAELESERWTAVGFFPYVIEVADDAGQKRFSVRVGPFSSRKEALATQERLVLGEGIQTVLRFRQVDADGAPSARPPA